MGVKRISRGKLFNTEKQGTDILSGINISNAMKPALVSATQHRQGFKVVTDLLFDFGAPSAALKTKALAADDPVGPSSGASYLCQVTDAVFGVVTKVKTVCLEDITDGTLTDYDLIFGDANGSLGTDPGSKGTIRSDIGTKGADSFKEYNAQELKNKYLYLASGDPTGQKATCTIDLTNVSDVTKVVNAITTLRVARDNGTDTVDFVANSSVAFSDDTPAGDGNGGTLGIGSVDNKFKLTEAVSHALHESTHFTTDTPSKTAGDGTSVSVVTVTVANVTATSNNANSIADGIGGASGITISNFTGGIDDGVAITSGKLLIRLEGFFVPDDLN